MVAFSNKKKFDNREEGGQTTAAHARFETQQPSSAYKSQTG